MNFKEFGPTSVVLPAPVLIIETFNENGKANAMNAAWGSVYDTNKIFICLDEHKTTDNIKRNKNFSVAFGIKELVKECDYFGLVSGKKVPNKVEKAGLTAIENKEFGVPIIEEFPITLICELDTLSDDLKLIANIKKVIVNDNYIDSITGKIDFSKIHIISYNSFTHTYQEIGENVAKAFDIGKELK